MLSSTLPVRFSIEFFGDELSPGDRAETLASGDLLVHVAHV